MTAETPAAKPECEHYWAYHCYGGLSVRLCQLCHEPDWYELRAQLAEAERQGRLAEREWITHLAEERRATYDLTRPCGCGRTDPRTGDSCVALIRSGQSFADLIREQP